MLVYDARDSIDLLIHHIVVQLLIDFSYYFSSQLLLIKSHCFLAVGTRRISFRRLLSADHITCFVLFRAKLLVHAFGSKGMVLRLEHSPPTIVRAANNNGQQYWPSNNALEFEHLALFQWFVRP